MSLQTKVLIFQTIALLIAMPIVAFATHGVEILIRSIRHRVAASRAVDVHGQLADGVAQAAQSSAPVAETPRGRRESKKSRRRLNRLLKAELKDSRNPRCQCAAQAAT
jgi:predicted kinase